MPNSRSTLLFHYLLFFFIFFSRNKDKNYIKISVDLSPFCELMGRVKTFALDLDVKVLESIIRNPKEILEKLKKEKVPEYFKNNKDDKKRNYYEIVLLAFLDTMGFASRSSSSIDKLFPHVLERYVSTIKYFQSTRQKINLKIG